MTNADRNWGIVFEHLELAKKVEQRGFVDVNAKDIKALGIEPRLITKVDHSHQLPQPLKENGLTILTLSSSAWRLGPFEIFKTLPDWQPLDRNTTVKRLPTWIDSIDPGNITGEGALMNAAYSSGILDDFCQERLIPTVSGKSRSGKFSFTVDQFNRTKAEINVDGAQIEIDAGYEGDLALYLFEAKKHISMDFNVRQLYYPFRTWLQKVRKPIKPIFITLANDVFDLSEYSFADPNDFSSAELVKHGRYTLSDDRISQDELLLLAKARSVVQQNRHPHSAPFPQADDFERVMDLAAFIGDTPRTVDDISLNYEFHSRQSDYYFSALRFLGLAELQSNDSGRRLRALTEAGYGIMALPPREKKLEFAKLLLGVAPVRDSFIYATSHGSMPSLKITEEDLLRDFKDFGITGSTAHRRAQTAQAWARWLINLHAPRLF